jgi:hypothetical protein
MSRGNFIVITPERVADHLEGLIGDPAELREQLEANVISRLQQAEITARFGAVLFRRVRDKHLYEPSGWPSWRDFCAYFSPQEPERIDIFIRALEVLESRGEKRDFGEPEARELAGHGGDRRSAEARKDQADNISLKTKHGTDPTYLQARLAGRARGNPKKHLPPNAEAAELLRQVEAGAITAYAAAREAGIIKPPDPFREMKRWWRRGSDHDRMRFEEFFAQRAVLAADHAEERRPTVLAGESSPHPTVIVPLDVELAAVRLRRHFAPDDRARPASLLVGEEFLVGEDDQP